MDGPLAVELNSPARNARLLVVSSQPKPLSSHASFQNAWRNFTDSSVAFELMTTFFPLSSTSAPPKSQSSGYEKVEGSRPRPSDCPTGLPFAFIFLPTSRH